MSVFESFRLDGKVAIITGGSAGLGKDMACALAEAGCYIILTSRQLSRAQKAVEFIKNEYQPMRI